MFNISMELSGGRGSAGRLEASHWVEPMRRAVRSAAIEATLDEAHAIMEDARSRTPIKTGDLRSTGRVARDGATVTMSFGGRAASGRIVRYAVYVHEITWYRHRVGEAKFLENAINAARAGMESRMARRVILQLSDAPFRTSAALRAL